MDKNVENKLLCDVGPSGWRQARMLSVNCLFTCGPWDSLDTWVIVGDKGGGYGGRSLVPGPYKCVMWLNRGE